jgi:hypothetical protein
MAPSVLTASGQERPGQAGPSRDSLVRGNGMSLEPQSRREFTFANTRFANQKRPPGQRAFKCALRRTWGLLFGEPSGRPCDGPCGLSSGVPREGPCGSSSGVPCGVPLEFPTPRPCGWGVRLPFEPPCGGSCGGSFGELLSGDPSRAAVMSRTVGDGASSVCSKPKFTGGERLS